jgi:hypothetical protein
MLVSAEPNAPAPPLHSRLAYGFASFPLYPAPRLGLYRAPDQGFTPGLSGPTPRLIQPKLIVGAADDPLEREADRVADEVMGGSAAPAVQPSSDGNAVRRSCASCAEEEQRKHDRMEREASSGGGSPGTVQRKCASCTEEDEKKQGDVHRKPISIAVASGAFSAPAIVGAALTSSGQPMEEQARAMFEKRLGFSFAQVRVHADATAAASAQAINALAYTAGNRIVFGAGAYQPRNPEGQKLLAHELTHVIQQGHGVPLAPAPAAPAVSGALGQAARSIHRSAGGIGTVQRQELIPLPPEGVMPPPEGFMEPPGGFEEFSEPEMDIEELPEIGEEVPDMGEEPEMDPEGDATPEGDSTPDSTPETDPAPDTAPEGETDPGTKTTPDTNPSPHPVPPVVPAPDKDKDKDKDEDKDLCGSKKLPPTLVIPTLGPLGQAGTVSANPLTRCPGNTKGSQAKETPYQAQFDCIRKAKQRRLWFPMHMLHGETRRTSGRNLHGPGDTRWNIIIGDTTMNRNMNEQVERHVLMRVFDLNQVLWFESKVNDYFPGNEFFAKKVTVTYGLLGPGGVKGPPLDHTPWSFETTRIPPACPPSLKSVPALPGKALSFKSTLSICENVLPCHRYFSVKNGGLRVVVHGTWRPKDAPGSAPCSTEKFFVTLKRKGLIFDSEVKEVEVPSGKAITLTWKHLPDDDYCVEMSVSDHNPDCCLTGDVGVFTFDAPKPPRRRKLEPIA